MFARTKQATEQLAYAAQQHASAADQVAGALAALTDAAEEVSETAATVRDQGFVLLVFAGVATVAVLVVAALVVRSAAR